MDLERWLRLMGSFGFPENQLVFNELQKLYGEKHRTYHNTDHITDCLLQLDSFKGDCPLQKEIELAFWFHDCIYNPYGKDNELKSAEKAKQFLLEQQVQPNIITSIFDMIMATLHIIPPKNDAEALLVDIDLSILGTQPHLYQSYSEKIREEYKRVPSFLYRKKRKQILAHFLKKERIYHTETYHNTREIKARENIISEISFLSK